MQHPGDPAVGEPVRAGQPLFTLHTDTPERIDRAKQALVGAEADSPLGRVLMGSRRVQLGSPAALGPLALAHDVALAAAPDAADGGCTGARRPQR